jgi:hypothetical protein
MLGETPLPTVPRKPRFWCKIGHTKSTPDRAAHPGPHGPGSVSVPQIYGKPETGPGRTAHLVFLLEAVLLVWLAAILPAAAAEPARGIEPLEAQPIAADCARDGRLLQRQAACAFGKDCYLVAWCDGSLQADRPTADIYAARIDPRSGKSLDPAGIRVCGAPDLQERPAVAFDGTNFLVVWQDFRNGKDYDIYAARVSPQGRVLDADGFPVICRPGNQARPAVAYAGGHFVVAWMDARQYPVYGVYAARVTTAGKVLDPEGRAIQIEDPAQIEKVMPPGKDWLGDRHYWWQGLSSRFQPCLASDGKTCLVTWLADVHANKTTGHTAVLDPASLEVLGSPVQLSGEPRDRLAACPIPGGWAVAFDHWIAGWGYAARMATLRLDDEGRPRDEIVDQPGRKHLLPVAPLLDVQGALGGPRAGDYQQGKGHFAFWQAGVACAAKQAVVVMDFGWRTPQQVNELNYAVVATRLSTGDGRFLDNPPLVLASGSMASGRSVRRPVIAADPEGAPEGRFLVVYENDLGIDRLGLEGRVLRLVPTLRVGTH